jgi:hypothetical protein
VSDRTGNERANDDTAPQLVAAYLFLEFTIPRMGRRVDAVVVYRGVIFVLEYKVGEDTFSSSAVDQVLGYGLYGDEGNDADKRRKLEMIDDGAKAKAFLRLLDLTIGTTEGAVIPWDLAEALEQIRSNDPALAESPAFARLATAARR